MLTRHEQIKRDCMDILECYFVTADSEFTLPTGQRIDVVGYSPGKNQPDIGIEVELTSDLSKDASKLLNEMKVFQLKIIVTENPETLKMRGLLSGIEIVQPPDVDTSFEDLIRKYTNQENRPWCSQRLNAQKLHITSESSLLNDFENEMREQQLNVEFAKDIIFRSALGGIYYGYYLFRRDQGTKYFGRQKEREVLYLDARHFLFEGRSGRSYETGRTSIYYISSEQDAYDLAKAIINERVDRNKDRLQEIAEKYGTHRIVMMLLGMDRIYDQPYGLVGEVNDNPKYVDYYWKTLPNEILKQFIERYNVKMEIINLFHIYVNSPLVRPGAIEIYKELTDANLGNKTEFVDSYGQNSGDLYVIPLTQILNKLNIEDAIVNINLENLRQYAYWFIIRSLSRSHLDTLFDAVKAIGGQINEIQMKIDELFKLGITSRLIKDGPSTIAIYDEDGFREYCEKKMRDILENT